MAGLRSELAGCRSTLSMSKIKVKISETKYRSFFTRPWVNQKVEDLERIFVHLSCDNNSSNFGTTVNPNVEGGGSYFFRCLILIKYRSMEVQNFLYFPNSQCFRFVRCRHSQQSTPSLKLYPVAIHY